MADDLMDFTDTENKENGAVIERDENDIPIAPGLVQSPVIVNSILKQSNKDNLIQLYTPVQKPEKGRLKVRVSPPQWLLSYLYHFERFLSRYRGYQMSVGLILNLLNVRVE